MDYILLAIATMTSTAKALSWKKIGSENQRGAGLHLFNTIIFSIASITVLLVALLQRKLLAPSAITFLLALFYAVFSTLTQVLFIKAMGMGEASITQLVYSLGLLLPIGYGALFLNEAISPMQIVGVGLVVVALSFIANPKANGKFNLPWFIISLLSATGSGSIAIVQKLHQSSSTKDELLTFVVISLVFSSFLSFIFFTIARRTNDGEYKKPKGKLFGFLALCGFLIGVLNISTSACAGLLPSVIQFPVYNIGSMVLIGIFGYLIFKEKLNTSKLIGFAIGCVAVLLIGLF